MQSKAERILFEDDKVVGNYAVTQVARILHFAFCILGFAFCIVPSTSSPLALG
jgi:hypothetical protein